MGNDNVRFVILSPLFLTSDGMLDYIIGRSKRLTKSIFGITIKDLWKAERKKERMMMQVWHNITWFKFTTIANLQFGQI